MEISVFIRKCLTYGIQIHPFNQRQVIEASEKYKIPDDELTVFSEVAMRIYVNALYLTTCEDANSWTAGLSKLKKLGFKDQIREEGHRHFVTVVWPEEVINN